LKDYHGDTSQTYQLNIKSEEFKEEESESLSRAEKESEKKAKEEKLNKKQTYKKSSSKTTRKKETTTEFRTAVLTESYESYSQTLEKNNKSILIIGISCVATSVCAMCVALFRKKQ